MQPLHPIPLDVVYAHVARHLSARDLCRLLRVSKAYYECFICDAAWASLRARCVAVVPLWQPYIFDAFPWKPGYSAVNKRHKGVMRDSAVRAFKSPRGGLWYCFKTYVSKTENAAGLKLILNKSDMGGADVFGPHGFPTYSRNKHAIAHVAVLLGAGIANHPTSPGEYYAFPSSRGRGLSISWDDGFTFRVHVNQRQLDVNHRGWQFNNERVTELLYF